MTNLRTVDEADLESERLVTERPLRKLATMIQAWKL